MDIELESFASFILRIQQCSNFVSNNISLPITLWKRCGTKPEIRSETIEKGERDSFSKFLKLFFVVLEEYNIKRWKIFDVIYAKIYSLIYFLRFVTVISFIYQLISSSKMLVFSFSSDCWNIYFITYIIYIEWKRKRIHSTQRFELLGATFHKIYSISSFILSWHLYFELFCWNLFKNLGGLGCLSCPSSLN